MNFKTNILHLSKQSQKALIKLAKSACFKEICGVLIGSDSHISDFIQISNISTDDSRFIFDPDEHIKVLYDIDKNGTKQLGVFHSHPFGPSHPSETDIQENLSKDQICLIISNESTNWMIKTFALSFEGFTEINIAVEYSE